MSTASFAKARPQSGVSRRLTTPKQRPTPRRSDLDENITLNRESYDSPEKPALQSEEEKIADFFRKALQKTFSQLKTFDINKVFYNVL